MEINLKKLQKFQAFINLEGRHECNKVQLTLYEVTINKNTKQVVNEGQICIHLNTNVQVNVFTDL